ncbi:hypothetical protein QAD02_011152 [Eretmocerus hayati]|uniref:Uncharacterized protein n=1 Tax=Eretmocerus hayati TaxID=131215 RepID=A0ACC2NW41_9HYME|nr:hypothetical protein QAD02_011152 [Eretmocerus hayati]
MALSHGAVMVSPEFGTYMPFKSVLQYGDIESMNLFIENGLRMQDCGVQFPLHEAIMNPDESILEYLLRSKLFDVDGIDDNGSTALLLALSHRRIRHVRLLIEWGADVRVSRKKEVFTDVNIGPLVRAMITGQPEVVKLLLAAGASIDLSFGGDVNISHFAPIRACTNCSIEYLVPYKSKGYKINDSLKSYLKKSVSNIAKTMNNCKTELNLLRTVVYKIYTKLYGHEDHITLYELLLRKDITRYLSNVQVKAHFESSKLEERFPHYGMQIREFYSWSLLKRELMNSSLKGLRKIFGSRFCGDEIYLNITMQLSIKDLRD